MVVLEAGCGLGDDAYRIAERVMPGGKVVAIDSSSAMIEKAGSRRLMKQLPVEFRTGDVKALPFPNNSFARCRIDRVLQHVPQPGQAISELVRVLEPGGLLLAYDNDWETFSVEPSSPDISGLLENMWSDSFTNKWIGRELSDYFIRAGLSEIGVYPARCVIRDFETADRVYNLRETARRAAAERIITENQGRAWIEELVNKTRKGGFMAAHTAYTVLGKK